jgi:dolichol-phosphate mannosyltransferase
VERDVRALVVLPTYNERENLPGIVEAILGYPGVAVLVVDDNSPDGTGRLADELARRHGDRVRVIHREGLRGLGRSYLDGLQQALNSDAELILQMDADWSHDPSYLPQMLAAAAEYDVVIGSRYVQGVSVVNWPLRRILLSTLANRYVREILGLVPHDCTSGYRCWRREALARIPFGAIASEGYAFLVELLFEADATGCRIGEVPIIFVERRAGASKVSKRVLFESLLTPWRLLGRRLLRHAHPTRRPEPQPTLVPRER